MSIAKAFVAFIFFATTAAQAQTKVIPRDSLTCSYTTTINDIAVAPLHPNVFNKEFLAKQKPQTVTLHQLSGAPSNILWATVGFHSSNGYIVANIQKDLDSKLFHVNIQNQMKSSSFTITPVFDQYVEKIDVTIDNDEQTQRPQVQRLIERLNCN